MENVSELTFKQLEDLPPGKRILLVHPPADEMLASLATERPDKVNIFSWDAATVEIARNCLPDDHVHSGIQNNDWLEPPHASLKGEWDLIIIYMPKAKERLDLTFALLAPVFQRSAAIALVGEKRSGVESAGKRLKGLGWDSTKMLSARHSQWWQIKVPAVFMGRHQDFWRNYPVSLPFRSKEAGDFTAELSIYSLPGVFSHGELDGGTVLLLETMAEVFNRSGSDDPLGRHVLSLLRSEHPTRILDFGCGAGIISLWLLHACKAVAIDSLDIDQLALLSAQRNLAENPPADACSMQLIHADGIAKLSRRYHIIVSNPPFHHGQRQDLTATSHFLGACKQHLVPGGELVMVANRFLPYPELLEAHFRFSKVLRENSRFRVYYAVV